MKCVLSHYTLTNEVRVIEGKMMKKRPEGNINSLRVSRSFELSRVRVSEGKITVNVRSKSRGNQVWFELARGSSYRGSELPGVNCTSKCRLE